MTQSAAISDEAADVQDDLEERPTFFERVLPDNALGRWAIYLVIVAGMAALLWYVVFPKLQHLLPEGF